MASTNVFINWQGATWTPSGGSATPINRVTDIKPARSADVVTFKGDADVYDRVVATPAQMRKIEVTSADVLTLAGIAIGDRGAFSAKLGEAYAGITTSGGGFTLALTACVVTDNTAQGQHGKVAEATLTLQGYAADGTTDPMTATAL